MNKIKNIPYFIVVLLLQYYIFIIADIPVKLSMWKGIYNEMEGHCYTPFITVLPAIYFWIRIAKILTPAFENSKIIKRLSENTFSIMMHHQFVAFCLNFLLLKINSIKALDGFNVENFRTKVYYAYEFFEAPASRIIYLILGIAIPVLIGILLSKIKDKLLKAIKKTWKNKEIRI